MPYDKEHNLTSLPESKEVQTKLRALNEEDRFSVGEKSGTVLNISSGSILVRWDSYKDCDWEGVEVIRRAFNQRIAPETKVMLL